MTVTPLMWRSLDKITASFTYHSSYPVEWDPKSGTLVHNPLSRKLLPWAVMVYIYLPPFILMSFLFTIAPLLGANRLPFMNYVVMVVGNFFVFVFIFIAENAMLLFCQVPAQAFNCLVSLQKSLESESSTKNLKNCNTHKFIARLSKLFHLSGHRRRTKPQKAGQPDYLGYFLNMCVSLFSFYYPIFLCFFLLYFEFDPLFMLYKYYIPSSNQPHLGVWLKVGCHLLRLLQCFPVYQTTHILCKVICLAVIGGQLLLSCVTYFLKTISELSNPFRAADILLKHKSLEIILLMLLDIVRFLAAGFMAIGFILSVAFNFATLKMYHIIPMPLYLYCPSVSVLIPALISILLPMAISLYERDAQVHAGWRNIMHKSPGLKLLKRELSATKTLRFYAGFFGFTIFELKPGVKSTYYYAILDYTMTLLLSIDLHVFM